MAEPVERHHASPEVAAEALADVVATALAEGLARRGRAALGLSGGRTPERFLSALGRRPLDWPRIAVTLVDERWVPEENPRANAGLLRRALFAGPAAAARFLPLFVEGATPEAAAAAPHPRLAAVLAEGADAAVIGLGHDLHTASLFPGGDRLADALDPARAPGLVAMRAPGAGEPRITWNLAALLRAGALHLQIEGVEKARAYRRVRAMAARPDAARAEPAAPALTVLRQAPALTVHLADIGAALN